MTPPRMTPGTRRDLGLPIWLFSKLAGRVTGTTAPHIFTTLGRNHGLFWGWLHFAGRLMPGGKLPRRETELVILRVAHLRGSAYEFDHHQRLGRRAGITAQDIERVRTGPAAEGWTQRERMLMQVTEELLTDHDLSDQTWHLMHDELGERTTVELLMLVGHYDMLATTLHTLRVQPDRPR